MAVDAFLKFDRIDQDFFKLGSDFDHIGDGLNNLLVDALKLEDHKVAHDFVIKHDIDTIGLDFIKLGTDSLRIDDVLHKFDDLVIKFADQTLKLGGASDLGNHNTLSDDFLKLDTDFHFAALDSIKFASDFHKLNDSHGENADRTIIKLAGGFSDFGNDLHKVGDDFQNVGTDFKVLGGVSESPSPLDQAFIKLGGDEFKIGDDLHKVSDDLLKIAFDIKGSTDISDGLKIDQSALKIDQLVLKFADDFHKLDTDLHTLGTDVKPLGGDLIKVADALLEREPGIGSDNSTALDSLHQILQHSHDFSLL